DSGDRSAAVVSRYRDYLSLRLAAAPALAALRRAAGRTTATPSFAGAALAWAGAALAWLADFGLAGALAVDLRAAESAGCLAGFEPERTGFVALTGLPGAGRLRAGTAGLPVTNSCSHSFSQATLISLKHF